MEIKNFFDNKNFYGFENSKEQKNIERTSLNNYFYCILSFKLDKGKINISKKFKEKEEGLSLGWFDLIIETKISDDNIKVSGQIKEFYVDHFSGISQMQKENRLRLLNSDKNINKPFLNCLFETKNKENKENFGFRLFLELGTLEFKFFPLIMRRAISYFTFSSIDEDLKEKAHKQVENLQKLTQKSFQELMESPEKMEIYLVINSPIIIIPLNQNEDYKFSCIIVNLGDLKLISSNNAATNEFQTKPRDKDKTNLNISSLPENHYYDEFTLEINSTKIYYYNSFEEYEARIFNQEKETILKKLKTPSKFSQEKKNATKYKPFKIIKKFRVAAKFQVLKKNLSLYTEKEQFFIQIKIDNVQFGLHSAILVKIEKFLKMLEENIENSEDLLLFEKKHLLESAEKLGILYRYDPIRKIKERRLVVLVNMYLYFFEGPEKTNYENYYYLREISVEYVDNGFVLTNKQNKKLILVADDEESFQEWLDVFKQIEKNSLLSKDRIVSKNTSENKNEILKLLINAEIDHFQINFYDHEHILWLGFDIFDLFADCKVKESKFELATNINYLFFNSFDFNPNVNSEFNYLISNCPYDLIKKRVNDSEIHQKDILFPYKIAINAEINELENKKSLSLNFPGIFVNWKPKAMAKLLEFLMKNLTENKQKPSFTETPFSEREGSYEYFEKKASNKSIPFTKKLTKGIRSTTSIDVKENEYVSDSKNIEENFLKFELNFKMDEIFINLITPFNIVIGKIQGKNLEIDIFLRKNSIDVNGSLHNLSVFDVTNYPLTDFNCSKRQSENNFELIFGNKNEKVMDFEFFFIDDDYFVEDKIYNYIKLSFKHLNLKYLQQPVLRIIDYLNDQILGVITNDYKTDLKTRFHISRLKQIVRDPRFTDIKISIQDCNIFLLILPLIEEYLKISVKEIFVENSAHKDFERIKKEKDEIPFQEFIFVDIISIIFNRVTIYNKNEAISDLRQFSSCFNLEMNIKRIMNSEEVKVFLAHKSDYDDSIQINIRIDSFKAHLNKPDYLKIMKILYNNILYDDNCDQMVYFGPVKKSIQNKNCREIYLSLNIMNFCFSICENQNIWSLKNFDDFLPTIELIFKSFSVKYCRFFDYRKKIEVKSENLFGFLFIFSKDSFENFQVSVQGFANNLNNKTVFALDDFLMQRKNLVHSLKNIESLNNLNIKNSNFDINGDYLLNKSMNDLSHKFGLEMETSVDGEKKIIIVLRNFDMLFSLNTLFRIINFTNFDSFVNIVTPREKSKSNPLILEMSLNNINLFLQGTSEDQICVGQGNINLFYQKHEKCEIIKPIPTNSVLKKDFDTDNENGVMIYSDPQSNKGMKYSSFKIDVPDLNILKWNLNNPSLDAQQKNFLINLSVLYESTNFFNPNYKDTFFNKSKISISHLLAHLSPDDISLVMATFNQQMEGYWADNQSLSDIIDEIYTQLPFSSKKSTKISEKNEIDDEEINEFKQKIIIEDGQIFLLNALKEKESKVLSPFLKIIIKMEPFIIKSLIKTKKLMSCSLDLFVLFYNPFSNKTEPLLEKTPFFFDFVKTPEGISYFNCQLRTINKGNQKNKKPMLNLNISEDMLAVFFKVKDSWLKKIQGGAFDDSPKTKSQKKLETPTKKLSKETLSTKTHKKFISRKFANSYTIKNVSGYDLRIKKYTEKTRLSKHRNSIEDQKNYFLEIKNGQTIEYEIEGNEDFFEQKFSQQIKIYIEFDTYCGKPFFIQNIAVNRARTQQVSWKSLKLAKENLLKQFFICYTKLKESKTKLTISSPIVFINQSSRHFTLTLISEDFPENLQYSIPPHKKVSIPLEYAENQSMFSLDSNLIQEKTRNLESFDRVFTFWSLKSTQGARGFEAKDGDFFYLVRGRKNSSVNKFEIYIENLFYITNCLPIPIELEFFTKINSKEEKSFPLVKIGCQETFLYSYSTINEAVFMRLQLQGFQKSDDILVFSNNMNKASEKVAMFSESKGQKNETINIYMFYQSDDYKVKSIFIYCKGCIINETKKDLLFYSIKTLGNTLDVLNNIKLSKSLLPGQFSEPANNIILFDETSEIAISLKAFPEKTSNNISIKGVAEVKAAEIKTLETNQNRVELLEFAVNISSKCSVDLSQENKQPLYKFTKIVEICPKYIVVNNTNFCLEIRQAEIDSIDEIFPNERTPFYWKDCAQARLMSIRLKDTAKIWKWSGGFEISTPKTITFLIKHQTFTKNTQNDESFICFFRVVIHKEKEVHYIAINCLDKDNYPYLIHNKCKAFQICFQQIDKNQNIINKISDNNSPFVLYTDQKTPFAWPFPNKENLIEVAFFHYGSNVFKKVFSLNSLTHKIKKFNINTKNLTYEIQIKYKVNGPTIILELSDKKLSSEVEEEICEQIENCYVILIQELGISIIGKNQFQKNVELCYFYFKDVEMLLMQETNFKTFQLRIKYLNIDNNSEYDVYNQVMLTPSLKTRYLSETNSKYYCLDFIVKYNDKLDQLMWLHSVEIHIMPFTIRLEEEFIDIIFEYYHRVLKLTENRSKSYFSNEEKLTRKRVPLINCLFQIEKIKHRKTSSITESKNNSAYDWEWLDIPQSKSLYINEIVLPALDLSFSFNQKLYQNKGKIALDDFSLITNIAEIFGTTFKNVNSAPIQAKGLRATHIFDSRKGVLDRFGSHYKEIIYISIIKIIGSINIIGNPLGLVRSIGSGVVDLIEKPIEGAQRGPLGLGIGILEGGSSLIKKTVTGTLNSVSALTETMGTGLAMLTFDEKYILKRSKMMLNKPKHIFQGLYAGGNSFYKGVKSGVKSVFIFPKEGIEKEGYPGLFKGSVQGLSSLVIKPIGGLFDATSKTAEGLKNIGNYYEDKANDERFRAPRAFYEEERFIKRYDKEDAKLLLSLQKFQKGKYADIKFIEGDQQILFKKNYYSLILSYEYIILIPMDGEVKRTIIFKSQNILELTVKEENKWLIAVIFLKDQESNNSAKEKIELKGEIKCILKKLPDYLKFIKDYYEEKETKII